MGLRLWGWFRRAVFVVCGWASADARLNQPTNESNPERSWLQMSEILGQAEGAVGSGQVCRRCSGLGVKVCAACEGTGQARLVVL